MKNFSFQLSSFILNVYLVGSESDQPKRKRGKKNIGTRKEKSTRRGAFETLKGKIKSKETISTSESDSDTGGLKIASG